MARHGALLRAVLLQISPDTPAEDLTAFSNLLAGAPRRCYHPARRSGRSLSNGRAGAAEPLLDVAEAGHRLRMTCELLQQHAAAAMARCCARLQLKCVRMGSQTH